MCTGGQLASGHQIRDLFTDVHAPGVWRLAEDTGTLGTAAASMRSYFSIDLRARDLFR
jgi:hypothetical protein